MTGERGAAPVELALGIGLLVIPMALLALSISPWIERQSMARVVASEVARMLVLSEYSTLDEGSGEALAVTIAQNHSVSPSDVDVFFCPPDGGSLAVKAAATCGTLSRGDLVTIEVVVRVPAVTVLGLGTFGDATVSATHTEQADLYRSIPP